MPKLSKSQAGFSINIPEREVKELELVPEREYDILKARKGLYVLMDKNLIEEEFFRKIDERIFSLLENSSIQDRVEERFERMLSKFELHRFNDLLKQGKVERFKASDKYKKAVYKIKAQEAQKQGFRIDGIKQARDSSNSFITVKTEKQARELNDKYWKDLKDGILKGIKDFDNNYYLIDSGLLAEKRAKILKALQESKSASVEELSAKLSIKPEMVKGVCAFLKEEGEILEKKKGVYNYIP